MSEKTSPTRHSTGTFKSGGLALFEQSWLPGTEPKAAIIIVHGLAEHSSRYEEFAATLTGNGYAVYTFDLRGHGRSEGPRVFVNSFEDFLMDLDLFFARVGEKQPGNPLFLFGHSMGGEIAAFYVITRQPRIKGLLLTGPALKTGKDVSPWLVKLSGIISRVAPKAPALKLDPSAVSRDPAVVKAYNEDPLVYHKPATARLGSEILKAIKQIGMSMEAIKSPLLVMHGTADRLTNPEGSKELIQRAASTDKTLRLWEGLYHEILNEPEKEEVKGTLVAWLDKH